MKNDDNIPFTSLKCIYKFISYILKMIYISTNEFQKEFRITFRLFGNRLRDIKGFGDPNKEMRSISRAQKTVGGVADLGERNPEPLQPGLPKGRKAYTVLLGEVGRTLCFICF
jgi:hypothetical protein